MNEVLRNADVYVRDTLAGRLNDAEDLIRDSYLSAEKKDALIMLMEERVKRLSVSK